MSTTIISKTECCNCLAAITGKCPKTVQFSTYCPKQPGKPLLSRIKENKKHIALQLLTVEKN